MNTVIVSLKNNWPVLLLTFLALITRFAFLGYPAEVVFDEVHFGKFVSAYFSGQYYFDIHPPLGKLLIAAAAHTLGISFVKDPESTFGQIGSVLNKKTLFAMRFLPALFGAMLVPLIYFTILALGLSKKTAFLGGTFVLFDNALLVQSRFILIDIFILFFGFLSLYLFLISRSYRFLSSKNIVLLVLSAVFAASAAGVKMTGLSFLGLILVFIAVEFLKTFEFRKAFIQILLFSAIPFLVYFSILTIHLKLLPLAGPGNAYMSQNFQELSSWGKFAELNKAMISYNTGLTATHPFSSKWYEWPYGKKPIWYWSKSVDGAQASIYLTANPVVWWLASLSVLIAIFSLLWRKFRQNSAPIIYLLIFGYFINLLPFLAISRVTFLYHYFPSLIFGVLIFGLLCEKTLSKEARAKKYAYPIILSAAFAAFILLGPLTYGIPISPALNNFYNKLITIFS